MSTASLATPAVAPGHVRLIPSHSTDIFYLEIPIEVIDANCIRPVKYLRFLGWCILGRLGAIKTDRAGTVMADGDSLRDRAIYYFVTDATDDTAALQYAVDLEVLRLRSYHSSSQTSEKNREDAFKASLVQRDAVCVFTNTSLKTCQGSHIIPFHKGDEWFNLIVQNRPAEGEDVSDLNSTEDVRNGLLLTGDLHTLVDQRHVAVVKTPNPVLGVDDIPPRQPLALFDDEGEVKYPDGKRYTMQWFKVDRMQQRRFPNNSDAAFRKYTRTAKPSPMLLHYNYGAAAIHWWGKNESKYLGVSNRPNLPRPSVPVPPAMGLERTKRKGDHLIPNYRRDRPAPGAGAGEGAQEQDPLDVDEIILLLWARNPAAVERRRREAEEQRREEEERASRLQEWRQSVTTT